MVFFPTNFFFIEIAANLPALTQHPKIPNRLWSSQAYEQPTCIFALMFLSSIISRLHKTK